MFEYATTRLSTGRMFHSQCDGYGGAFMSIEWDERKARRAQLQKFALALAITCMIAALPILAVSIRIGL